MYVCLFTFQIENLLSEQFSLEAMEEILTDELFLDTAQFKADSDMRHTDDPVRLAAKQSGLFSPPSSPFTGVCLTTEDEGGDSPNPKHTLKWTKEKRRKQSHNISKCSFDLYTFRIIFYQYCLFLTFL